MTDEEKRAMEITNDIDTMVYDCEGGCVNIYDNIERAVLVGIREGKPKWHDLRKDPEDLPKENGDYWCKLKDNRLYTFEVYYTDSLFYRSRWDELGIIAWCELPKFEE